MAIADKKMWFKDSDMNSIFSSTDLGDYNVPYAPQVPKHCFGNQDIRILSDRSFFEEYDALRKSYQYEKDFINDQDSVTGIDLVPNMIKNILCTQIGSFSGNPRFGINLTPYVFEQLDWVSTIALRDEIAQSLDQNLPGSVIIENVEILSNSDKQSNTVEISIDYIINEKQDETMFHKVESSGPGKNLNTKKVQFTLGVDGFVGFPNPTNLHFRRAQ